MMQEKRIEPTVAVEDHGGVSDVAMGSTPFAPVMDDIERMMQERRIEFIIAVEDALGAVDVAMGRTPFAPVMAGYTAAGKGREYFLI